MLADALRANANLATLQLVGNSIGDFVADTAAAKGSDVRMAVAACFGSPLLMNVLGIGVSLTIYTAVNGHAIVSPIPAQCRVGYFFLFLALLSSVVAFPLHDRNPRVPTEALRAGRPVFASLEANLAPVVACVETNK